MRKDQQIGRKTKAIKVSASACAPDTVAQMPKRVYHLLCRIPSGSVTTYGELGRALKTRGFRAIGRILNANPNAPVVPCHRVVMKGGSLGGYAGGVEKKVLLLRSEGVGVSRGSVTDFPSHFYAFTQDDEKSAEALPE